MTLHLWCENADEVFEQAIEAGARVSVKMMDAFWGDRYGKLIDPFGHEWAIATHKRDLSLDEMSQAAQQIIS